MLVRRILAVARKKLVVLRDNAPLTEAAKLLGHKEANLIIVCDAKGKLVGVISKTDIVHQMSNCHGASCKVAAAKVMTKDVAVCHTRDFLDHVWSTMKRRGLKHLPIVDARSRPIGLAIARDVLGCLVDEVQHEEKLLRDYIMNIGYR